jgi:hypothetical protein
MIWGAHRFRVFGVFVVLAVLWWRFPGVFYY